MVISKDYYNKCSELIEDIDLFMYLLEGNYELTGFINRIRGVDDVDSGSFGGGVHHNRVAFFIQCDLAKCYVRLGHPIKQVKKEQLPLYLLLQPVIAKQFSLSYDMMDFLYDNMAQYFANSLAAFAETESPQLEGDYGFFMRIVLDEYGNKELLRKYDDLIYRFATIVAKADHLITERESQWINGFDKLREKATTQDKIPPPYHNAETAQSEKNNDPLDELAELIGLSGVKADVKKLSDFIKIQRKRQEMGLRTSPISYHCVFTGNPGTGKTTVARILANIYRNLGILQKGHLVETDRSGLVAEYVGQTAVKTNKIIDSALDGVLFIDEAYSLVQGSGTDYGAEAIATLLKRMEDDRQRLVVILAGYGNEMKLFIDSNPGLQSRFNRYIHFEDYTTEDLCRIFDLNVKKNEYTLTPDAKHRISQVIARAVEKKDGNFGNARYVRNLFEKTLENQATRLSTLTELTKEDLQTITSQDI